MKARDYIIFIISYFWVQLADTLFMGVIHSLSVYLSAIFLVSYTIYFHPTKGMSHWILSFLMLSAIFSIIVLIVSTFFPNYTNNKEIIKYFNNMWFPEMAFIIIAISFGDWIEEQKSDKFIKIALYIYALPAILYGIIMLIAIILMTYAIYANGYHYGLGDIFFLYSSFIYFFLPLILLVSAHRNNNYIEKWFHLLYIVFIPIWIVLMVWKGFYFVDATSNIIFTMFIICLPFLFALKNLCIWQLKHNKSQKEFIYSITTATRGYSKDKGYLLSLTTRDYIIIIVFFGIEFYLYLYYIYVLLVAIPLVFLSLFFYYDYNQKGGGQI